MFPSHFIFVTEIIWVQIVHTLNVSNIILKFKIAVMLVTTNLQAIFHTTYSCRYDLSPYQISHA